MAVNFQIQNPEPMPVFQLSQLPTSLNFELSEDVSVVRRWHLTAKYTMCLMAYVETKRNKRIEYFRKRNKRKFK